MTPWRLIGRLFALTVLCTGSASAQEGVEVEAGAPVAGQALVVEVTVLDAEPTSGLLFYRPTGAPSFTTITPTLTGNVFRVEIPAEDMTIRGLEVYGEYEDDSGNTRTYPPVTPEENPIPIPVFIGSAESEVELPPLAYRMVSVPADLGGRSAIDVLADDFGALDPNRWRLVQWDPAQGQYLDAPEAPDTFEGGAAFWLITSTGGRFDIDAADSTPAEPQPITLEPGCNQIGNPFAFPVAWEDVAGSDTEGIEPPAAFDGTSDYDFDQTVLEPWTGYFVCNNAGQPVTLTVFPREAVDVRPPGPPVAYGVELAVQDGTSAVLGVAPGAQDGRDGSDRTALPPVGEAVRVSAVAPDGRLARSVKAPSADGQAWDVEVAAPDGVLDGGTRRVTVALDELGARPDGFEVFVIDRDAGAALPISGGAVEVVLRPDAPTRALRVILGTEAFARSASEGAPIEPVAFGLDAGYPNPFAEAATLRYRLAARGPASIEVFDLLGRRVRVLADGVQPAGSHAVVWDGRDAAGRRVASGVYLVRLRAGDATVTRRLSVLR